MMRRLAVALAFSLASAAPAFPAENVVPWKTVNGWQVAMDATLGNGCFILTAYDDGTVVRLGFNLSEGNKNIYLAFGNPKWKSIEVGKDYPLEIQFDNNPVWKATGAGIELGNAKFLFIATKDTSFAEEFSRKLGMRISFNGRQVAGLKLKGSSQAIGEMLDCQDAVAKFTSKPQAPETPSDPFNTAPQSKSASDPFEL